MAASFTVTQAQLDAIDNIGGNIADILVPGAGITLTTDEAGHITISAPGSGGGGFARTDVSHTTAELVAGATGVGALALGPSYMIQRIALDQPARLRLYSSPEQRDADLDRAFRAIPTGDHGLILDVLLLEAGTLSISPTVIGANLGTTNTGISITNVSEAAAPVTATITYLRME